MGLDFFFKVFYVRQVKMALNLAREHCMKSSTKNQSTIGSSIELTLWLRLDDHNIQVKFESFK